MQVTGHTFVVTGGGNGIGREVVLALLERGARVAAVDLRADGLEETAGLAGTAAERLSRHPLDVTDAEAVAALPEAVLAAHGQVDGLLNVAGIIQPFVRVADLEPAVIEKVMGVNFGGTVATVRAFLPLLLARPAASIVNVSSMGALVPVPGQAVYGASKAAVMLFTEALYAELRGTPVAVTVVFPGGVATHITDNSGVDAPAGADAEASATTLTTPQDAARQVIGGLEAGRFRVVIGRDARMMDLLSRLSPRRATDTVARRMASLLERP
ncbi:SDR family oxidoreductase [Phycicoccus endophyticus]|uniref:SDR family oxidoreductase n=1 Tax=Phycicoccus endophyticus TaxID=1690220 RepID=A0A7G9R1M6_9MICO|nr:SDR family oxidoreductase [Phycicoccus endophyticus]NHI18710.1 SDR family oxidoreductase [Phycicoccus endophyticus]QNN49501.1 SDR family oxidoreductase [Phycicoccus endophyticus]GGL37050.1 short-chain dehydrogenase [Phycicoccus endophyticus]